MQINTDICDLIVHTFIIGNSLSFVASVKYLEQKIRLQSFNQFSLMKFANASDTQIIMIIFRQNLS